MELTKDKKLQANAFVLAVGPAATGNQTYYAFFFQHT